MKKLYSLCIIVGLIASCSSDNKTTGTPPVVEAGTDVIITSQSQVQLIGSVQDKDNDIDVVKWEQTSGPEQVSLLNSSRLSASFSTPSVSGVYAFRLTVTDKSKQKSHDEVMVHVDLLGGVWVTNGSGELIDIRESLINFYEVTTQGHSALTHATCLRSAQYEREAVEQEYGMLLSEDRTVLQIEDTYYYRSDGEKYLLCDDVKRLLTNEESGYQFNAKQHLDIVFNNTSEFYPFFSLRGIDQQHWEQHFLSIRDSLSENASDSELFEAISDLFSVFEETQINDQLVKGDGHVSLLKINQDTEEEEQYSAISDSVFVQQTQQECDIRKLKPADCEVYLESEQEKYLDTLFNYLDPINTNVLEGREDGALMVFSKFKDRSIGYMLLQSMADMIPSGTQQYADYLTATNQLMSNFVTQLNFQGVEQLVIDLRMNGGGFDDVSLAIASYFVQSREKMAGIQNRIANDSIDNMVLGEQRFYELPEMQGEKFNGDLYVLTSRSTGSAAEMLVAYLLSIPTTHIIGESTRGNFSSELWKKLPNGWHFSIANEVVRFPDASGIIDRASPVYEGTGIPVEVSSTFEHFSSVDRQQGKDSALEYILQITEQ